ncbi:MAG: MATE family efflux transporter, partial [Clostridia bacterium]|nr:MATE family efflux transporter [Clostridia bacterium]
ENILPYSVEYMQVILLGTVFFSFAMASNNIIRSEGNAKVAMGSMLISGGLNIILDPIFIFVFKMGVKGAAIATVLSQVATVIYLIYYFISGKSQVKFKWKNLIIDVDLLKEIFSIGSPSFARQVAGSFMAIVINNGLAKYGGDIAISAFGVINRLLSFVFMPMFGIVQGLQPIIGYNYGARKYDRVRKSVKLGIFYATAMSVIGFFVLMIFPEQIISLFNQDAELIETGTYAMRIIVIALPLVGFQVVGASIFQAIGKALPSLILSMSRQILFLIPLVLILPLYFGLNGVFGAFPVADILSALITFIMVVRQMKEFNVQQELKYTEI